MTRNRILLPLAWLAIALLLAACGDDDIQLEPDIGEGPAEDVSGVWQGEYTSEKDAARTGSFCWNLDQDGRQAQGEISFDGGEPIELAGLVAETNVQLVWGSTGVQTDVTAAPELGFASGGTLTGQATGGGVVGTYVSLDGDRGDWLANKADGADCG